MADLNNCTFTGRLTKDCLLKPVKQYDVGEFSIAVNGVKEEDTFFLKCTAWGKLATNLSKYLLKGKQVAVCGSLKLYHWTDRAGNDHDDWSLNCNSITLLGGKNDAGREDIEESDPITF